MNEDFEERKIIIGLVMSTEFIQRIKNFWSIRLIETPEAKRIAMWCIEYYDKYNEAPKKEIETIYFSKKKKGLPEDVCELFEDVLLPGLSEEFVEDGGINVDYLVDVARKYFGRRNLQTHIEKLMSLLEKGNVTEAEKEANSYMKLAEESNPWIDLSHESIFDVIHRAFNRTKKCLIPFEGAIGEFWNKQLYRGAFVALMGPEKRGKSYWLLEFAMRARRNKKKVALFQAGDMDDEDQIMRIANYLTHKSEDEDNSGKIYEPTLDCILNQTDFCDKRERTCDRGIFNHKIKNEKEAIKLRKTIAYQELIDVRKTAKGYKTCTNCEMFKKSKFGTPWIRKTDVGPPLTEEEAKEAYDEFFVQSKRSFRISTHANGTLTVKEIENVLGIWEREGFISDVIIIDYADLLTEDSQKEERHRQNKVWKDLRGLSQKKHALIITATQTDAASYSNDLLTLDNYSEDKRKYGHVTAMYGLNQDPSGREKELGVMRINEIMLRKGKFSLKNQVHVLQNLTRGIPCLTSYY